LAKPVVDGIARELNEVPVVRVDVASRNGSALASGYGVRGVPALIVFNGDGEIVLSQAGRVNREAVVQSVRALGH
jgi:thiol-disulfide isomerase/thioredoxin